MRVLQDHASGSRLTTCKPLLLVDAGPYLTTVFTVGRATAIFILVLKHWSCPTDVDSLHGPLCH